MLVKPAESGHGINVSTYNINYCTTGMYKNALLTAGVEDADIIGYLSGIMSYDFETRNMCEINVRHKMGVVNEFEGFGLTSLIRYILRD